MNFRWLHTINKPASPSEIQRYMMTHDVNIVKARRMLKVPDTKVLQILTEEGWVTIPTEVVNVDRKTETVVLKPTNKDPINNTFF